MLNGGENNKENSNVNRNKENSAAVTLVNINEYLLLPDENYIFSLSNNAINIFGPKYGNTVVAVMNFRTNLQFAVARNDVLVDIVLEIHDALVSKTAIYNARIWCHYISWYLNIFIDNLDKDESTFT